MQQYPPTADLLPPGLSTQQKPSRFTNPNKLPPIDALPSKVTRLDRKNHPYNKEIWANSRVNQPPLGRASMNRQQRNTRESLASQNTGTDTVESGDFIVQENAPQESLPPRKHANTSHAPRGTRRRTTSTRRSTAGSSSRRHTTAPSSPSFVTPEEKHERIQKKIQQSMQKSAKMSVYRLMQRRLLKEDYELNREQLRQEDLSYKQKQVQKWKKKLKKSPFAVDLLADSERVEEEMRIKRIMANKKKRLEQKKLEQLKQNLLMNALLEEQAQMQQKMIHQQMQQQHQYRQHSAAEHVTSSVPHGQQEYYYDDEMDQQGNEDFVDETQHDIHEATYANDTERGINGGGNQQERAPSNATQEDYDYDDPDFQGEFAEQEIVDVGPHAGNSEWKEGEGSVEGERFAEQGIVDVGLNAGKNEWREVEDGASDPYKEESFLEEGNDDDEYEHHEDFLNDNDFEDSELQQFENLEPLQDLEKFRKESLKRFSEGHPLDL